MYLTLPVSIQHEVHKVYKLFFAGGGKVKGGEDHEW
jgi:hypothetical protein